MIRHDLSHWPLVLSVARGPSTLAEHDAFLAEWNHWLDRGERFATLRVFADAAALAHPDGAARGAKAWLQANAGRLQAQVTAMATVVPPEQLAPVRRMNAEKLFGVPAQAFGGIDDALDWLERVAAPASTWRRDAAAERLRRILGENRPHPSPP
ncbi:hypothetical protein [Pseudorhodoferax sp.]|uniref:hypothetical protein n=1 Tax=Pseudorhodoferax sp. TaxID=1993553 RepID=UPI0039E50308